MARTPGTLDITEAAFPTKQADTNQLTRGGNTVQREVVSIGSPEIGEEENILRPMLTGEMPVVGPLTNTELRAVSVPVSGTVATGGLTDVQLRATPVPVATGLTQPTTPADTQPVSGTFFQATQPVSGPLTDVQLRASAVPVSGPLTDTQLRATPVPVSGTVTASGPLTDTQLRASAVPISAASLPLPTGASTEATLALIKAKTDNLDVLLSTRTKPADTQKVDGSAVTQPVSGTVTANQGTAAAAAGAWPIKSTDAAGVNQQAITAAGDAKVTLDGEKVDQGEPNIVTKPWPIKITDGVTGQTASVGDIASNCLDVTLGLQVVQVDGSGATQPISAVSLPLPLNASREHVTAASPHSARLSDGAAFYNALKSTDTLKVKNDTNVALNIGPLQTAVGVAAVQLLAANGNRRRAIIQNTGTTIIYLGLSVTDPTTTVYMLALAPGAAANDGKGAIYIDDMSVHRIAAIGSAASGTVVVTELN